MQDVMIIGIAGGSGSGKTTLAQKLKMFLKIRFLFFVMIITINQMIIFQWKNVKNLIMTILIHLIQIF